MCISGRLNVYGQLERDRRNYGPSWPLLLLVVDDSFPQPTDSLLGLSHRKGLLAHQQAWSAHLFCDYAGIGKLVDRGKWDRRTKEASRPGPLSKITKVPHFLLWIKSKEIVQHVLELPSETAKEYFGFIYLSPCLGDTAAPEAGSVYDCYDIVRTANKCGISSVRPRAECWNHRRRRKWKTHKGHGKVKELEVV